MDFALDDGQLELQQTVARFCADRFPLDALAGREGVGVDRATWRDLAALGTFGLLLDEDSGGSGLGPVEAAIVFEQLGSHLVSGPVLWTVLAAPHVDGAVAGDTVVGGVEDRWVSDGAALVEHADGLDALLVLHHDRLVLQPRDGDWAPEPMVPLDPLTPVSIVHGLRGGRAVGDAAAASDAAVLGRVLVSAMLAGVASRALDVARAYALERQQFGAPIGSFQAIKHLLADMYVRGGQAQSATYAAAAVLEHGTHHDATRAAAAAKLLAGEAAIANAAAAVQVLGGMGFTWDMLPNYLVKRAWLLEQAFGSADEHARELGTALARR